MTISDWKIRRKKKFKMNTIKTKFITIDNYGMELLRILKLKSQTEYKSKEKNGK